MGLFKKKEKEPEVFYDSKISLDGGINFLTAEEAMPIIEKLKIWSKVYDSFDPKIFERVRKTSLEFTPLSVLKKYLSYSPNNIVMGKKKRIFGLLEIAILLHWKTRISAKSICNIKHIMMTIPFLYCRVVSTHLMGLALWSVP